jgi:cytochrome c oxidase subunit III
MNRDLSPPVAFQFGSAEQQSRAATLGLWVFLTTELMFFGPLFFGYWIGRLNFPDGFAAASRHTDVTLGTINTAILLTSSLTMVLATVVRKLDAPRRWTMTLLWVTAALGIVFLIIKGTEYAHEWHEHLFPGKGFSFEGQHSGAAQLFFILYFAMTALHAVHLTIGIVLVSIFAIALQRNAMQLANAERIELAGLYWHFVDVVWIFLYPILYLVGRSSA